jgi:hypothetical protein
MGDLEHGSDSPFDSIESAQHYLTLLCGTVEEAADEVNTALKEAMKERAPRREQALRLAAFHLVALRTHMIGSLRALNDLRMLRRLIFAERTRPDERKRTIQPAQTLEPEPSKV